MRAQDIKDRESFEAWLNEQPEEGGREIAVALAHRTALRVLPNLSRESELTLVQHTKLVGEVLLCVQVSRVAAIKSTPLLNVPAFLTASRAQASALSKDSANTAAAAFCSAYSASNATDDASVASNAAASVYITTKSAEAVSDIWKNIQADARAIDASMGVEQLLTRPLWVETPTWYRDQTTHFNAMLEEFAEGDKTWLLWKTFHTNIANGKPGFSAKPSGTYESLDLRIALGDGRGEGGKDFWDRDLAVINAEIAGWLEEVEKTPAPHEISSLPTEEQLAQISKLATQFTTGDQGELAAIFDPASPAATRQVSDLEELYDEARLSLHDLQALGKNALGQSAVQVDRFSQVLPVNYNEASINRVASKTASLRSLLEADSAERLKPKPDQDPQHILPDGVVPLLRATIEKFNLFLAHSERGRELNSLSKGPAQQAANNRLYEAMRSMVVNVGAIGNGATVNIITGDHSNVATLPASPSKEQELDRVVSQEQNMLFATLLACRNIAKGLSIGNASHVATLLPQQAFDTTVAIGGSYGPRLIEYVATHADVFTQVFEIMGNTVTFVEFVRLIVSLWSLIKTYVT